MTPRSFQIPFLLAVVVVSLVSFSTGQTSVRATTVPAMVKFSGTVAGAPSHIIGIAFALYKDQQGGAPLWLETQSLTLDTAGRYTVQLGATLPNGLPKELFASGDARWLGVQPEGQQEQPRILLLSVPYALKAADAETIGGFPPSAFVLATPAVSSNGTAANAATSGNTASLAPPPGAVSGTGTANFIPLWTDGADIANSVVFQSGTGSTAKIGINTTTPTTTLDVKGTGTIRGLFTLPSVGVATAVKGSNSQPVALTASAFNSTTSAAVNENFRWQAEPVGNNTATPSGTLNLLFASGTSTPVETGLKISSAGLLTFATGQTFPGAGTISGVTAGSGLTGGGTNGNVTLNLDATKIPQLNVSNTFTGNQTVSGNLSATGAVTGSVFQIGSNPFGYGSFANSNAFLGFGGSTITTGTSNTATGAQALSQNGAGSQNTAMGASALLSNTSGSSNTAVGNGALTLNSTGSNNTASGAVALQANTTGSYNSANGISSLANNTTGFFNTAVGYLSGPDSANPSLNNSTAIGALATVTASNSMVLGSIAGVNGAGSNTNVGIGTTAPAFTLDVHGTGNFTGPITFAAGQAFPNTISGVTAGTGLTGGGTTGNVTVNVDTTKVVTGVAAGTGLTGGGTGGALTLSLDTTKVPLLNVANSFIGNQSITGNLTETGNFTANGSAVFTGTSPTGIIRVNQNSTSFGSFGISALSVGPSGTGVYGQANDSNGFGVEGLNNSATGGYGVLGAVNNTSGVGVGVWGKTFGGSSVAVKGDASSATTIGVVGTNTSGGLAGEFFGPLQVNGNFTGTGTVTGTTVNATSGFNLGGNLFGYGDTTSGNAYLGFAGNTTTTGSNNTATGAYALNRNSTGAWNTGYGANALSINTTGAQNTAVGFNALGSVNGSWNTAVGYAAQDNNLDGNNNTAIGFLALGSNLDGSNNTAVGYRAGTGAIYTNLTNATAIGANAEVDASNALVLGSINGVGNGTASTNVGIGTTTPTSTLDVEATAPALVGPIFLLKNNAPIQSGTFGNSVDLHFALDGGSSVGNPNAYIRAAEDGNSQYGAWISFATMADGGSGSGPLERMRIQSNGFVGIGTAAPTHVFQVAQGLGAAFADSWSTYSSRRWKTNIQTIPNALKKVEQLRGVSYDLKGNGKHEIGVIAEEVGQVVPEVVSFEQNGKDAQGVDYSRLTALLIEAVKQQQTQILAQQRQIHAQQEQIVRLSGKVGILETALRSTRLPAHQSQTSSTQGSSPAAGNKFLAAR